MLDHDTLSQNFSELKRTSEAQTENGSRVNQGLGEIRCSSSSSDKEYAKDQKVSIITEKEQTKMEGTRIGITRIPMIVAYIKQHCMQYVPSAVDSLRAISESDMQQRVVDNYMGIQKKLREAKMLDSQNKRITKVLRCQVLKVKPRLETHKGEPRMGCNTGKPLTFQSITYMLKNTNGSSPRHQTAVSSAQPNSVEDSYPWDLEGIKLGRNDTVNDDKHSESNAGNERKLKLPSWVQESLKEQRISLLSKEKG